MLPQVTDTRELVPVTDWAVAKAAKAVARRSSFIFVAVVTWVSESEVGDGTS